MSNIKDKEIIIFFVEYDCGIIEDKAFKTEQEAKDFVNEHKHLYKSMKIYPHMFTVDELIDDYVNFWK